MAYVITRNGRKHFRRRIPKSLCSLYPENVEFVQTSLKTDSETVALQRAMILNQLLEDTWQKQRLGKIDGDVSKVDRLVDIASSYGLEYKHVNTIAQGSLAETINRLAPLSSIHKPSSERVAALLGKEGVFKLSLSSALERHFELEEPNLYNKSQDQIRKWKNPRKRAVKNFTDVCGDINVESLTRNHLLEFKTWWSERINGAERLSGNAANKDLIHLKCVLRSIEDNYQLGIGLDELFKRLRFPERKSTRPPFPTEFIQSELLNLNNLTGLNNECRWFLFAMADTGARPSELVGLDPERGDIRLDTSIPYIHIRPDFQKELKTPQSERMIPLVGASLIAFQNLPNGFEYYSRKADSLSNSLNKYLRENKLLPTEEHCIYSLRHSFEDRLTAVEPPDKVQAALMGHAYSRPRYGDGPSIEQKWCWMERIAFDVGI